MMISSLLLVILVAAVGELVAAPLLSSLHVPEDVLPSALLYLRIYLLGMPVILLYNFEAAIFRSVGNTRTPLIALFASGILNVVLNLFFVAFLRMTVKEHHFQIDPLTAPFVLEAFNRYAEGATMKEIQTISKKKA